MGGTERRVALIEVHERDGRIGRVVDVFGWPLSLGRALDNDIVVDDPHVAAWHARLVQDEGGRLLLEPLPALNPLRVDGRRVEATLTLPAGGAEIEMGTTRLRLRLPGETLAPEEPLRHATEAARWALPGVALAVFALLLAQQWVSLDPGAGWSPWLPVVVGAPGALAGWCAVWALLSKVFRHRFDFSGHLRIVLPWLLALLVVDTLWPLAMSALAAPTLWRLGPPLQALLVALMLRDHLAQVLPTHRRAVDLVVAALVVGGGGLSVAGTWRSADSLSALPYMSTLPVPALRLAGTVPDATLIQEMPQLAARLAERVKKSRDDDEPEADASE